MRKKQGLRIVSSILAASMALTMMPTAAFAAGTAGTSGAENSAVVQSVGSEDTLTTLEFENGIPKGTGSMEEGWVYQVADNQEESVLIICKGSVFDRDWSDSVYCRVRNQGTIKDGAFYNTVANWDGGVISGGYFTHGLNGEKYSLLNEKGGVITGGNFSDRLIYNEGTITNANFGNGAEVSNQNGGHIEDCDIPSLSVDASSTVENCVFGLAKGSQVPANAHSLAINVTAYVNFMTVGDSEWENMGRKLYATAGRRVMVQYVGDKDTFGGWTPSPTVTMETSGEDTVTFTMPDVDLTLTADEKAMELTFDEDGNPVGKGNKTSKWVFNGSELILYDGFVFNMPEQVVNCYVTNYGTIKSGSFTDTVANEGKIEGGAFSYISRNTPDNMHTIAAVNATINGVFDSAAYIVGNQKVTISANLGDEYFNGWNEVEGLDFDKTAQTIDFTMPDDNVVLTYNRKDHPLEIGADGKPTYMGGENWEYIKNDYNDLIFLYDGMVFEPENPVTSMVVPWPGATIKGGTYEEVVTNLGTIENGTFKDDVNNAGTIQDGTFDGEVMVMSFDGTAMGGEYAAIAQKCDGVVLGGTFNDEVYNGGTLKGGIFNGKVTNVKMSAENVETGADMTGEIADGEFNAEVTNIGGKITGGNFKKPVANAGELSNGAFWSSVKNTTLNAYAGTATYTGSISNGAFFGTVTNDGGEITGGVYNSELRGDAVANVHTLTAADSQIGTAVINHSGNVRAVFTQGKVYTIGNQEVFVYYAGSKEFGSWKSDDMDMSSAKLVTGDGKGFTFTMPGDKDVTLTASAEKPVEDKIIVVKPDEKPNNEGKTIEENLNNQGTLNNGTYTGEVSNGNTIAGGTFTGNVSNDEKGKISDGEFKAAVQNAGTIENGKFAAVVTNDETGKITNGEFTGKVENKGTIQNGTFADIVTNNGTIENGKFAGEVKGTGTINGGTFQQVSEAAAINGGVFGTESNLEKAKVTPSALKIETGIADGSVVNDVISGGAAVAMLALFEENDVATQAADAAETVAYVVGDQTLTVKYSGSDKNFDKWDTTGLTDAKLSEDGKTVTFKMSSDVTLKAATKKSDSGNTDKPAENPQQPANNDSGAGALIVGGVLVAGGVATGVLVYKLAVEYIQAGLPEGAAIPETREQLAVALWQKAGQPEVAVEEGVTLTDSEKAMRWAVENQLVSAEGEDSVDKIDVLVAVYKASKL